MGEVLFGSLGFVLLVSWCFLFCVGFPSSMLARRLVFVRIIFSILVVSNWNIPQNYFWERTTTTDSYSVGTLDQVAWPNGIVARGNLVAAGRSFYPAMKRMKEKITIEQEKCMWSISGQLHLFIPSFEGYNPISKSRKVLW